MTGERDIDYEGLVQDAMRGVVRSVLARVAKSGLPGEHHFYIAFKTDAPGVSLSERLRQKYPEEMTVVLQHRFWELAVRDTAFEVKLTFDGIPERLVVPFEAIKVFFDPSVPYGLQFDDLDAAEADQAGGAAANQRAPRRAEESEAPHARTEKRPRAPRRTSTEKAPERPTASSAAKAAPSKPALPTLVKPGGDPPPTKGPKVVSIDAFRKK